MGSVGSIGSVNTTGNQISKYQRRITSGANAFEQQQQQ